MQPANKRLVTEAAVPAHIENEVTTPGTPTATALSATYALGGGASRTITGPTLPPLPAGTEYVWNKTDGAGTLLDILTGVA